MNVSDLNERSKIPGRIPATCNICCTRRLEELLEVFFYRNFSKCSLDSIIYIQKPSCTRTPMILFHPMFLEKEEAVRFFLGWNNNSITSIKYTSSKQKNESNSKSPFNNLSLLPSPFPLLSSIILGVYYEFRIEPLPSFFIRFQLLQPVATSQQYVPR